MSQLEGKIAIVTGAGSGIGRETAMVFAKEGAKVTVSDINDEAGRSVVDSIKANGGQAIFIKANSASLEENRILVDETVKAFGGLHISVNNAGVGNEFNKLADIAPEDWSRVIDINLTGVFYGMKYQIPAMIKSGGGSVINVASILGQVGFAGSAAYVASKHGVVGLTKAGAIDHAQDNVRINAIGPGFVYTGLVNENTLGKDVIRDLEQKHALHRLGESPEVAALCLFLASDSASFITGAYYPVDGGYLAL
ncbi:MAG TPA: SDR family NAD(P)-dependent oxidoreductase [Membranihabitans sp.]|nr:SDR family NAD(P)-dependent oxidoreductase [Membranihabitans sp.]